MLPAAFRLTPGLLLSIALVLTFSSCGEKRVEFTHGVSSGDAVSDGAVLWTRTNREVDLTVEVSIDESFNDVAFEENVSASNESDYTAKISVAGLEPSTQYYYRFKGGDETSPVGSFRTAPADDDPAEVTFIFSGDSDGTVAADGTRPFDFSVLNAAREERADFFIYLGDTIYADSPIDGLQATALDDYRARYRANRELQPLLDLLASTSTFAVWDDHEVTSDFAGTTVDSELFANGRQAFREYMPISGDEQPQALFRRFRWGKLVDLIILDERSYRDASALEACTPASQEPDLLPGLALPFVPEAYQDFREELGLPRDIEPACESALLDPERTMLGDEQKKFLFEALRESDATFKFIVNEVPISELLVLPYDRWEGYRAERDEILSFIAYNGISNVVFLTTDFRGSIIAGPRPGLAVDPLATEAITGPIGHETVGDSIERTQGAELLNAFELFLNEVIGVKCTALDAFSYGLVDVTPFSTKITLKDEAGTALCQKTIPAR